MEKLQVGSVTKDEKGRVFGITELSPNVTSYSRIYPNGAVSSGMGVYGFEVVKNYSTWQEAVQDEYFKSKEKESNNYFWG